MIFHEMDRWTNDLYEKAEKKRWMNLKKSVQISPIFVAEIDSINQATSYENNTVAGLG